MASRKDSEKRVFQTSQFRRATLLDDDRLGLATGISGVESLDKVIWPEPLGHLLPPEEWAPVEPESTPAPVSSEDDEDSRSTMAPVGSETPTLTDSMQSDVLVDGRYRVLDQLGSGGMARILKVRHVELGRDFALKIIRPGKVEDRRFRRILLREARIISQLEHPNIVGVTDFGADPNFGVFIVMEYLKGQTLYERVLEEQRLRLPLALDIMLQTAEALRYMHDENIVHRDLKAENIFLCRPPKGQRQLPVVKIIDFGLSGPDAKATFKASSGVVGTPVYMAPEQLRGMAPRASMDIYAMGVLLYELLTGRPPFVGKLDEIITAHLLDPPPPPSGFLPEPLDGAVERLILKALSKSPEDRQGSMRELVYELRTLMDMLGLGRGRGNRRRKADQGLVRDVGRDVSPEQLVFEATETPLFLVDAEGVILTANQAMARFMRVPARSLRGTSLVESRLTEFYPELEADLRDCIQTQKRSRRLVTIPRDPEPDAQIIVWLSPVKQGEDEVSGVSGLVVPFLCNQADSP